MNKKAIFLDVDGTLLNDEHQMPEENVTALKKAVEAGHEVVITTGRPTVSAGMLLSKYGLDQIGCRYVIAFNGGIIKDCKTGEIFFSHAFSIPRVKELIEYAREADIYIQTYEGDVVLTDRDDEHLEQYTVKTGMKKKVVSDLLDAVVEEPCKMLAIHLHDQEKLTEFCARMEAWAKDKADMYFSCKEYLEIVPKGICKGNALRAFCEKTGIPVQNTIAAGDDCNDLSMIEAAGLGCAVANAVERVKEAADYVTLRNNNQAAIAEIVEKFMLDEA
ncbi:MAG: HAD family phosphatase [Lachnospiraceae bacterium]|nr:HAD family phosphatase [Lachnospiraceae bacterium]